MFINYSFRLLFSDIHTVYYYTQKLYVRNYDVLYAYKQSKNKYIFSIFLFSFYCKKQKVQCKYFHRILSPTNSPCLKIHYFFFFWHRFHDVCWYIFQLCNLECWQAPGVLLFQFGFCCWLFSGDNIAHTERKTTKYSGCRFCIKWFYREFRMYSYCLAIHIKKMPQNQMCSLELKNCFTRKIFGIWSFIQKSSGWNWTKSIYNLK